MTMKRLTFAALIVATMIGSAEAAPRRVCFELRFKDDRSSNNCATSLETGNRRGCSNGEDLNHMGAVVELWDKDPDGSDELIGRWVYQYTGGTCAEFEWDNNSTANAEHEANPDVYVRYVNEVRDLANTRSVIAVTSDGGAHSGIWWRNGVPDNPDLLVANECTEGIDCWIFPQGWMLPSDDVNTDIAKRAMVLDSAQHGLEVFAGIMTANVNIRVPDTTETCPLGCNTSRTNIQLQDDHTTDGFLVTHELGHVIQKQIFTQDSLRNDCSKSGDNWSMTSDEYDSCASQEGLATYAGLAAWYDGGVENTNPIIWGRNFESAVPHYSTCGANRGVVLQVAKAFWDMDDITNEAAAPPAATGADDNDAWYPHSIVQAYSQFPSGTGNRQKNESDADGVNIRDYHANTNSAWFFSSATQFISMLDHNCLQSQDNN